MNFQYKFTVPLRELCKNSKRCIHLLNPKDDETYIELLRPAAATTKEPMIDSSVLHNTTGTILSNKQPIQSSSSTSDMIGSRSSSRLAIKFVTPSHNQSPIEETPHQPITTPVEATRTPTRRSISSVHAIERNDDVTEAKRRKPSTPHPARGVIKFDDQIEEQEEHDDETGENTDKGEDEIVVKKKHVLFLEEKSSKNSRIDEEEEEEESLISRKDDDATTQPTTSATTTTMTVTAECSSPPRRRSVLKAPMSENNRVMTSSLRVNRVMSATKSVKFNAVKYTRNICGDEHINVDSQENMDLEEDASIGKIRK